MKKLKPISSDPKEEDRIKKEIERLLEEEFFAPLMKILGVKRKSLQNSTDDLISAIRSGKIYYSGGKFRGSFDSTLTRELRSLRAEWDRRHDAWSIPLSKLPVQIRIEIGIATSRLEEKSKKFVEAISKLDTAKIAEKLEVMPLFDASLIKTEEKIKKSLADIAVAPKFTKEQRETIAREYTANTQKDIKGWLDEEVIALRTQFEELAKKGVRYESMIGSIQKSYGVSLEKARFWARQENNLITAKMRELHLKEIGVDRYEWRTVAGSPNHPVRHEHKMLDGKIFSWDDPPNTAQEGKAPRYNHPGEDYNCRCIAIPLIE